MRGSWMPVQTVALTVHMQFLRIVPSIMSRWALVCHVVFAWMVVGLVVDCPVVIGHLPIGPLVKGHLAMHRTVASPVASGVGPSAIGFGGIGLSVFMLIDIRSMSLGQQPVWLYGN